MPSAEQQLKYWQNRCRRAEAQLKDEEHINTFTISWLKRTFPEIHRQMHAYFKMNSDAKLYSLEQRRAGNGI